VALRPIEAFATLPTLTGESIEASRPVHIAFGGAAPGNDTTITALASAQVVYYLAQQLTISDANPIISVSQTAAIPLAQNTLQQAYQSRGMMAQYARNAGIDTRWYPAGERSVALAAGLMTLQQEEKVSANVLVGSFGVELALVANAAQRRQRPFIAVSDQLGGQAVAYALSDAPLIGEELFAAPAYLSDNPVYLGRTAVIDSLRWILVIILTIVFVINLIQTYTAGA
jgi:hypothetical protein